MKWPFFGNESAEPPQAADPARRPCLHCTPVARGRCRGALGDIAHAMKKKSTLILAAVGIALVVTTIAFLEIFHLHPYWSIGNVHAYWAGGRWTQVECGSYYPFRFPDGQTRSKKDYLIGPLNVSIARSDPK
jgi:hypothetical protein